MFSTRPPRVNLSDFKKAYLNPKLDIEYASKEQALSEEVYTLPV